MLRLWKKKKGRAATYNQLCRAFRKSKQLDLEDEMKEILAESNSLVDREGELASILGSTVVSPYVGWPENKMAATMQVLAFKRRYFTWW